MPVKNVVKAIPLKTLAYGSISSSYALVTAASGIPHACFALRIGNSTDVEITVSYDGVTDHDVVETLQSIQINAQANSQPNNNVANFAVGTQVWVKGSPGSGNVSVSGYYQPSSTT